MSGAAVLGAAVITGAAVVVGVVMAVVAPVALLPAGANPVPGAAPGGAAPELELELEDGVGTEGAAVVGEVAAGLSAEESAVEAEELLEAPEKLCAAATEKTPVSATPPATTQPVARETR